MSQSIKTRDLRSPKELEENARRKVRKNANVLEDQTFEDLNQTQKDELLKSLAVSARLIKPSE